jgi:hypothetical protein
VFERKIYFNLKIYGKLVGLSNKFKPSMVFDPSEFEGLRFDLYIIVCFTIKVEKHFLVYC